MNKITKFEDFIFNSELKEELTYFNDNPKMIPSTLCFYGSPGNGKTSFAKYIAETYAKDYFHFDLSTDYKEIKKIFTSYARSVSMYDNENAVYEKCIILDEFHNINLKQQETLKIPIDTYSKNNHCLFILCLNTDSKNSINDLVLPAILSRSEYLSFDCDQAQLDELKMLVKKKYPSLSDSQIIKKLPDIRAIQRLADRAA